MRLFWGVMLLGVFIVLGGGAVKALESLVVYDTFDGPFIDSTKWIVPQLGTTFAREYVREIQSNKLRMEDRLYGRTDTNSGGRFEGVFLGFPAQDSVTAIGADVWVRQFEADSCASNSSIADTDATLLGSFFNTDTPVTNSWTNDVYASLRVVRFSNSSDPANTLRIQADVNHCLNSSCSSLESLAHQDLGTATSNPAQRIRLLTQWDQPNHRFIFTSNGTDFVVPYTVSDTALPGVKVKQLHQSNFVVNCQQPTPPVSFMEAFFDRVLVNESAAP